MTIPSEVANAKSTNPFHYFDTSPDVIRLVVMMYNRYPLSPRNVEGPDTCNPKTRDKPAALKLIKKAIRQHGQTNAIGTDGLRSYGAVMKDTASAKLKGTGYWNNYASKIVEYQLLFF
jgi:transposase-like protein